MSSATITIIVVVAIIVVAAVAVVGMKAARRKRTEKLREQFGPEYDRTVAETGDRNAAEADLRERTKRRKKLELRELDAGERADFEGRWTEVKGEFVDDPSRAVRDADRLVVQIMKARGYPVEQFDQRADDLSVDHPEVTQRYRAARKIADANKSGSADTEELRQAVTSYRELIEALLRTGSGPEHGHAHTANGQAHSATADDRTADTRVDDRTDATPVDDRTADTHAEDRTHHADVPEQAKRDDSPRAADRKAERMTEAEHTR
jgi:hypothetical protein